MNIRVTVLPKSQVLRTTFRAKSDAPAFEAEGRTRAEALRRLADVIHDHDEDAVTKPAFCDMCKMPYGSHGFIENYLPDELWSKVKLHAEGGGLLCLSCVVQRCVDLNLFDVPVKLCDIHATGEILVNRHYSKT